MNRVFWLSGSSSSSWISSSMMSKRSLPWMPSWGTMVSSMVSSPSGSSVRRWEPWPLKWTTTMSSFWVSATSFCIADRIAFRFASPSRSTFTWPLGKPNPSRSTCTMRSASLTAPLSCRDAGKPGYSLMPITSARQFLTVKITSALEGMTDVQVPPQADWTTWTHTRVPASRKKPVQKNDNSRKGKSANAELFQHDWNRRDERSFRCSMRSSHRASGGSPTLMATVSVGRKALPAWPHVVASALIGGLLAADQGAVKAGKGSSVSPEEDVARTAGMVGCDPLPRTG